MKKAAKAKWYADNVGMAYIKALSACPLNWNDAPNTERQVIQSAVDCCYFPLYEVENGITKISYDPEERGKKIPVKDWLSSMGRTKHLKDPMYSDVVSEIQDEVDLRWRRLKAKSESGVL